MDSGTQEGEWITQRMLLHNRSKFWPSCQTSENPDSPSTGVSKSGSDHCFGTSLFDMLETSKPVSLQLSWSLRQIRAGVREESVQSGGLQYTALIGKQAAAAHDLVLAKTSWRKSP